MSGWSVDKGIRCNLRSQWELDKWHKRTSSLDPTDLGGKREKERERERKKELLERESLTSL